MGCACEYFNGIRRICEPCIPRECERFCRKFLDVSMTEAFAKLDAGEYHGFACESELRWYRDIGAEAKALLHPPKTT